MADTKTSDLTALAAAPADNDLAMVVDVSDTSMAASGTNKKITVSNLLLGHTGDSSAAHAASAVSFSPTGTIAGSDVQTAVAEVATDAAAALAAHEADTTGVHGITDTSALVTLTGSQTLTNKTITQPVLALEQGAAVAPTAEGRIAWDTDDNQIKVGDGAATKTFSDDSVTATSIATAVSNHEADTSNVHGITDTSVLVTLAGSQTLTNKSITASQISDFAEAVDDRVGVLVVGGTGITATYNDGAGTHTIATTITQYTDEMARDALGAALVAGSNITITPNDGADTITIAASGGGGAFDPSAADFVVAARVFAR